MLTPTPKAAPRRAHWTVSEQPDPQKVACCGVLVSHIPHAAYRSGHSTDHADVRFAPKRTKQTRQTLPAGFEFRQITSGCF
jgi:hypothetical protein